MSAAANNFRSSNNKKRRRRPPSYYHASTAAEERLLQHAIQNSRLDRGRPADGRLSVPHAPTFFPTVADFEGNPITYIEKIRPVAEQYGVCKIVPPKGWNPAPLGIDFQSKGRKFQTKLQHLHRLQEGISFGDGVEYSAGTYQTVASRRAKEWKNAHYPNHDLLKRHSAALEIKFAQTAAAVTTGDGASSTSSSTGTSSTMKEAALNAATYSPENLERDYWNIVETHSKEVVVEYGNDVDTAEFGSGFPLSERGRSRKGTVNPDKVNLPEPKFGTEDYYRESWWNINNIPCAPDSVLRHVHVGINGINVPWMYYGSLFSTFCWHNEDNYMYSINYHHRGAPKVWYGVPGDQKSAEGLEKVFRSYLSMKMRDTPDLLHHITTMFSPRLLQNADVPVYKIIQYEGEYVVTFPRAFHGGFSLGPNIGEAVNFATHDWIVHGSAANEKYRTYARPAVFSHDRLTFTMANHLDEQKSYSTCKLLLEELERVVGEELSLRKDLVAEGVRDVSEMINLPANRLDRLDEKSASYDDKRLCHACKHICFFSAVACECSQSKVSCLRHSHYMCRCPSRLRYFLIWSTEDELTSTVARVRQRCEELRAQDDSEPVAEAVPSTSTPLQTPGLELDKLVHKDYDIPTDPVNEQSFRNPLPCTTGSRALASDTSDTVIPSDTKIVTIEESGLERKRASAEFLIDDDEIEIVAVKPPSV